MERKYQVFVSSTYIDLIQEREAAVKAIIESDNIPAGMELFKAGKDTLDTIKKWIDESDIYIIILGKRYGSIDIETGLSYTEIEYNYAKSKGIPMFAIVLTDKYIKNDKNEYRDDSIDVNNKYRSFLARIEKKVVENVNSVEEIKTVIHKNIYRIILENKMSGWIKYDEGPGIEIESQKKEIDNLKTCLSSILHKVFCYVSSSRHELFNDIYDNVFFDYAGRVYVKLLQEERISEKKLREMYKILGNAYDVLITYMQQKKYIISENGYYTVNKNEIPSKDLAIFIDLYS